MKELEVIRLLVLFATYRRLVETLRGCSTQKQLGESPVGNRWGDGGSLRNDVDVRLEFQLFLCIYS